MRIWGHGDVWGYDSVKVKVERTWNGKFGQCDRFVCVCEIEEEFLRSWATLSLSHTSLKLPKSPHNSYHC